MQTVHASWPPLALFNRGAVVSVPSRPASTSDVSSSTLHVMAWSGGDGWWALRVAW